jgi:hypothetical protein
LIELAQSAKIRCDAPGCHNEQMGKLMLTVTGGFAVAPQTLSWQLAAADNGVFVVRCPDHRVLIERPADAPPEAKP